MNEPVRWIDPDSDAPPELRSLVEYAGTRGPNAAQLAALTDSVLAQLPSEQSEELTSPGSAAPTNGAADAARAAKRLPTLSVSLWVPLATLVVAAALFTTWALLRPRTDGLAGPDRVPAAEPAPEPVQQAPASASAPLAPIRESPAPVAPRQRSSVRERAPKATIKSESRSADPSGTASELSLLHAARVARRSAPSTALRLLREHERSYPGTALHEEREALMIEVLQQLDPGQAARRLEDFEQRYPNSGYRKGLRNQD